MRVGGQGKGIYEQHILFCIAPILVVSFTSCAQSFFQFELNCKLLVEMSNVMEECPSASRSATYHELMPNV